MAISVRNALVAGSLLAVSTLAAPAQAISTLQATLTGYAPAVQTVNRTIVAGPNPLQVVTLNAARFDMVRTGGTSNISLLGGLAQNGFLAFCIEPQQIITIGQSIMYNVVPLWEGANNVGGIGFTKANQLRELFGRFAPLGGAGAMNATTATAFQIAIWEISRELAGNPLDAATGDVFVNPNSNLGAFNLAQTYLSQIDGSGPFATGLRVLQNGPQGNAAIGTQDLLVFSNSVPEPASWAMLISGFGLTGAVMRRRRRAITA